ncbi:MAG: hypothetical protein JWR09_2075 [Mucilaginibacter sp.]|nr:hypothetical protein [Mucilaginibacter sp.]
MKLNFTRALICFFITYIVVTILATAISVIYGIITNSPPPAPGVSVLQAASFVATVPYHVLLMLLIWPVAAWIYFKKPLQKDPGIQTKETLSLSFFWLIVAVVTDFVCFVFIKHPYSLTPHEFYVLYQPWISLIYLSIFLSPLIRLGALMVFKKQ